MFILLVVDFSFDGAISGELIQAESINRVDSKKIRRMVFLSSVSDTHYKIVHLNKRDKELILYYNVSKKRISLNLHNFPKNP